MTIDEIQNEWEKDARIDVTDLGTESIKIAQVHSKYLKLLTNARLSLVKLKGEQKKLKFDKWEFLTQGPFKDDARGWKLPPSGKILKSDVLLYMEGDEDLIKLQQKIELTEEKCNVLLDILKQLNNRQWHIRATIDWMKFQSGG